MQLRGLIFKLRPASQDIKPSDQLPNVWGTLIESSFASAKLTIAVMTLADGSTSIYASEGAAYINIGKFPEIAEVANHILFSAEKLITLSQSTTDFPIATYGKVNFYIFTYSGVVMKSIEEKELLQNDHPFGLPYRAYREIMYRNRILLEKYPEKYASIMQ